RGRARPDPARSRPAPPPRRTAPGRRSRSASRTSCDASAAASASSSGRWSHPVLPWIVFFQNLDAIIGPDDAIVYPEALTNEMDYELELAVIVGKAGKFFSPEEAEDYIAGYLVFNDITARDIQRQEMKSGVFCLSNSIDTFVPIAPWIVTPDEVGDPHELSNQLR